MSKLFVFFSNDIEPHQAIYYSFFAIIYLDLLKSIVVLSVGLYCYIDCCFKISIFSKESFQRSLQFLFLLILSLFILRLILFTAENDYLQTLLEKMRDNYNMREVNHSFNKVLIIQGFIILYFSIELTILMFYGKHNCFTNLNKYLIDKHKSVEEG